MPGHALFVSPHLDDVAFSCGGALYAWLARGGNATVATVFTASVAHPTGFALACQTDKGLAPEVEYMALRRAEDEDFAAVMRAALPPEAGTLHLRHGPLEEAPHRGYDSAEALFAGVRADDRAAWQRVEAWLASLLGDAPPTLLFAPQGLGRHVDHLHVARAVRALAERRAAPPVVWYRDLPYALRDPAAMPCRWVPQDATPHAAALTSEALEAKLRGAAAYASQIRFQFGGVPALREELTSFAQMEGEHHRIRGPVEGIRCRRIGRSTWPYLEH